MIGKIKQGSGFAGVIGYDMKQDAELIHASNLSSRKENWAANMEMLAAGNTRLKKAVMHFSLNLPHGTRLSDAQWQTAANVFVKKISGNLDATQFLVIRHNDQKHDHVHIIVNRQRLDGRAINDSFIYPRTHEAAAEAARSVGLEPVLKPERGQHNLTKRGLSSEIRQSIDKVMKGQPPITLQKLKAELAKDGIKIILNQSKSTGRISGISFQKEGHAALKGSTLGKAYTAKALQERGLVLDGNQHQKLNQAEPQPNQDQSAASVGNGLAGAELSRLRAKGRTSGLSQGDKDRASKAGRGRRADQSIWEM